MRRRLGFIRHSLCAILWLVSIACCLEVGARILSLCTDAAPLAVNEIPTYPCARTHHQLAPLGQFSLKNPETDDVVEVQLNSLGLRGREPKVPKPAGALRIVCLGDELTFGPGLSDEQLFTTKLEQYLSHALSHPVEVINAGVPGYCPLLSVLQYRHQLLALDADAIVVTFDMNDVADDYACRSFVRLDENGVPLACRHPALDAVKKSREIEENFVTLKWLKQQARSWKTDSTAQALDDINHPAGTYAWIRENPPDWKAYLRNAIEPVGHLRTLAGAKSPLILFSVCPAPWQISEEATSDPAVRKRLGIPEGAKYDNRDPFQKLSRFAENAGWEFLDVSLAFERAGNPEGLYLQHAPWLSARGHELYAGILTNWLVTRLDGGYRTPIGNRSSSVAAEGDRPRY